jgi:carboxypeptidase PM20D1
MKTLFQRALLAFLVVSGLLTAFLAVRSAFSRPDELPAVSATPFAFDNAGALDRLTIVLRVPPETGEIESAFLRVLMDAFPRSHTELQQEELPSGSFLFTWSGSNRELEPVLLTAHLGTAPAGSSGGDVWRFPPFSGELAEGAVWGRGALSGRGPLVALFEAIEAMISEGFAPERTLWIAVGRESAADDPAGLFEIASLLESRGAMAAWALGDGGAILQGILPGVTEPVGVIGTAEQGAIAVRITARGSGGPAAAPSRSTARSTRSSWRWVRTSGCTCSIGRTCAYWTAAALAIVVSVSPVASDMRCK